MRETEANGWVVHNSSRTWLRALQLAAVVAGIGLIMSAGVARAQEDDEEQDNSSFSDKIIKGIMTGVGGKNMEPPQSAASEVKASNWPKDPDLQARKAAAAAAKGNGRPEEVLEAARPLTPAEMAPKRVRSSRTTAPDAPGDAMNAQVLSPSQLGVEGGLSKLFGGSNRVETAPFKGEPTRDDLTQPPTGYQTPSPNFAYGTGPKEALKNSADINPMTGKY